MRQLASFAMFMFLAGPTIGAVVVALRVDKDTWATVLIIVAAGLLFVALGGSINLYLRGRAKLEEARALGTAADARRIHGPPPTYNTTVNMIVMKHPDTQDVRYLPLNDPATAGSMMRQFAMQGYEIQ